MPSVANNRICFALLSPRSCLLLAIFIGGALLPAAAAWAQPQIQVRYSRYTLKKYDISYSRKNAPGVFEMSGSYNDWSLAVAEIEKLKRWDASMTPSTSSWRLAVILVETNGPLPTINTKRPLSEYISAVSGAYYRAKVARDKMVQGTVALTDSNFNQANQLIREFNSIRQEAVNAYGAASFASYPPLPELRWYYVLRYGGQLYQMGPFTNSSEMVNHFYALRRSYPSIVLIQYFTA